MKYLNLRIPLWVIFPIISVIVIIAVFFRSTELNSQTGQQPQAGLYQLSLHFDSNSQIKGAILLNTSTCRAVYVPNCDILGRPISLDGFAYQIITFPNKP